MFVTEAAKSTAKSTGWILVLHVVNWRREKGRRREIGTMEDDLNFFSFFSHLFLPDSGGKGTTDGWQSINGIRRGEGCFVKGWSTPLIEADIIEFMWI